MDFINTQSPTSVNPPIRTVYAHQDKFVNLERFRSGFTIQIKFTFTLYGHDLFNLYRLHPVPVMLHKETITIIPRTEFLAIDELTGNHIYLKELNDCASDYNITYCETPNTIITTPTSEASIIRNSSSTSCRTSSIKGKEATFIYLKTAHEWIYSLPTNHKLTISCYNESHETYISVMGILGMKGGCTGKTTSAIFVQPQSTHPALVRHFISKLNFTSDELPDSIKFIQQNITLQGYVIYTLIIIVLAGLTVLVTSMLPTSNRINNLKGLYKQLKKDTARRPTITHFNVDLDNLPPPPPPPLPNVLPQL